MVDKYEVFLLSFRVTNLGRRREVNEFYHVIIVRHGGEVLTRVRTSVCQLGDESE